MPILFIPVLFGFSVEVYFICLLISMPVFLFWRWLLRKYIPSNRRRQIAVCIATIVSTPLLYSGLIVLLLFWMTYETKKKFTAAAWKEKKITRYQMTDDLVAGKTLLNKDTLQLKQILGDPSYRDSANTLWLYYSGTGGGGLGFTDHQLRIRFVDYSVVDVVHLKIED